MIYKFEIISVKWHHNRGDFIFARHLGDLHEFNIPDGSILGDIPVYYYTPMRSIRDEDGNLHPDIFVFRPISMKNLAENHFLKGQKIKLIVKG